MASADEKMCSRIEKKADKLVSKCRRDAEAASGALSSAESEAKSAEKGKVDGGSVACGCVVIPIAAIIVAALLENVVGLFVGGVVLGLFQQGGFIIGAVVVIALVVRFATSSSRASRARARVGMATGGDDVAKRRLEDAEALQRRVKTATGRLRSATSDDELRSARSSLERLEREIDSVR